MSVTDRSNFLEVDETEIAVIESARFSEPGWTFSEPLTPLINQRLYCGSTGKLSNRQEKVKTGSTDRVRVNLQVSSE